MSREHHLISVKTSERSAANALFKGNLDTAGGELTFTVALWKVTDLNDAGPPDRYWCATMMTPAIKAMWMTLRTQLTTMTHDIYDPDINPGYPYARLAERGLRTRLGP